MDQSLRQRSRGLLKSSPESLVLLGLYRHLERSLLIHRPNTYPKDSTVALLGLYRRDSVLSQGLYRHILIAKPNTPSNSP